ncbi:hypothetical protein AnigIFM63604_005669 [Aspergillus niger]|uniref:Uncharacterized protein n=2 Tax=Aspergillus TaxID=5052 RepID=A0A370PYY8_ASPPH|nr:hypothetical protein CBS147346_10535 [Aspergillus niger]RDK47388.1 hypothetical protein M752DRAFT_9 [Aspergillus phoenicis ATCC 13157]GLA56209.1 hypothetical protein AnigIFM63604_005669 [Aspergillus niger]
MAAAVSSLFRYSTGAVATSETAKAFSWEAPVPVNTFWDSFEYSVARNFLANFSDAELTQLPIDEASSDDHRIKLQLLLRLLQEKLEQEKAATSPPQSLYTTDYLRWYQLWQGIYCLQDKLDLPEAEQTVRMLVEKRPDESNVVPPHMLADHLVKIGKYQEAEETERPVCAWMDSRPHLGPSSPQAINARRIIAQALWGQGPSRRSEAEALVAEIHRLVDTMDGGKFGVYQAEEKKLNEELVAKLHIS